jgi:hypothetical protein
VQTILPLPVSDRSRPASATACVTGFPALQSKAIPTTVVTDIANAVLLEYLFKEHVSQVLTKFKW